MTVTDKQATEERLHRLELTGGRIIGKTALFLVSIVLLELPLLSAAFSAQLVRPWEKNPTNQELVFRRRRCGCLKIMYVPSGTAHYLGKNEDSAVPSDEESVQETFEFPSSQHSMSSIKKNSSEFPSWSKHSSKQFVNGAPVEPEPTVRSCLGFLFQLTRPLNFPSIIMLHVLGTFLALRAIQQAAMVWEVLRKPAMLIALSALILTSSTSMVVNDYYDAKLGRDSENKKKALVNGEVPLPVARRFLSYLYAIALFCVAILPGIPTRLSVVTGLILTYWYTQYLKPITWIKNIVCASLIALSPLTAGSAALHVATNEPWNLRVLGVAPLWRLIGMLFFGVMAREIIMDCNDAETDEHAQVRTVPVVYGKRFASRIALVGTTTASILALGAPLYQLVNVAVATQKNIVVALGETLTSSPGLIRRLVLATVGSAIQELNAWRVCKTEGRDASTISRAVDQGLLSVCFLLLSFV